MYFYLTPRATDYRGLCAVTNVTFQFAPKSSPGANSITPTTLRTISTDDEFRLLSSDPLPPGTPAEMSETELDRANAACARVDPSTLGSFDASNDYEAYFGARLFQQVASQLKSGNPKFKFICDEQESRGSCDGMFDTLDDTDIWSVRECEKKTPGSTCIAFGLMLHLEVTFTGTIETPQVTQVRAGYRVVIADYRID